MSVELASKEDVERNYNLLMFQIKNRNKSVIFIEDNIPVKYHSKAITPKIQKKIFKLLLDGLTASDISDKVNVSGTTIGEYRRYWEKMGYL